jgi:hypothetical protein
MIRARDGSPLGISITSIRNKAVRWSPAIPATQLASSFSERTEEVPET